MCPYYFRNAFSKTKYLFALGMGGLNTNFPKTLKAFGWELSLVPFYFKIINTKNFIAHIQYLRKNKILKNLLLLVYKMGLISTFLRIHKIIFMKRKNNNLQIEVAHDFGKWANNIWEKSKNNYALLAIRDAKTLNILYPQSDRRFIILKMIDNKKYYWMVCTN